MTVKKYNVVVIGATGSVGRELLNILSERAFPVTKVYALASEESLGQEVSFGEKEILKIESLSNFDFKNSDIAFFCTNSDIAKQYIPQAVKANNIVIDKSSHYRMDPGVPLIVPEINKDLLAKKQYSVIASPNCITIPLSLILGPLRTLGQIKRIVISTYQSVSGAGRPAMDELFNQTKAIFMNNNLRSKIFPKQIAFNIIPCIDEFDSNDYTSEENKIIKEVQKILGVQVAITATCVRVPVFTGHCISANIEFNNAIDMGDVRKVYDLKTGVSILDRPQEGLYITPIDIVGEDIVTVSRLRIDNALSNAINMWITCDNLRKGAALNAVQIAENLY